MKLRMRVALVCAAMVVLSGCGPKEDVDAQLQRVVLDIPFGPVQDNSAKEGDGQP